MKYSEMTAWKQRVVDAVLTVTRKDLDVENGDWVINEFKKDKYYIRYELGNYRYSWNAEKYGRTYYRVRDDMGNWVNANL